MFEMKNEMDTTATKHKNEDFLKKLDEDRRKKRCEFAVLVSLLEPDNELYNGGIVDVSHRYEKMYVIRPQFFIPLITLLVQTSKKSLEYKKQLIQAQSREVDVTNFENKLTEFREKFGRHYDLASRKFNEAVKQIDDLITGSSGFKGETPNYIIVTTDRACFMKEEQYQWYINGGIYLSYLTLALHSLGIGNCIMQWKAFYRTENKLKELLGISSHEAIIAVVGCGYYQGDTKCIYAQRKAVSDTLHIVGVSDAE